MPGGTVYGSIVDDATGTLISNATVTENEANFAVSASNGSYYGSATANDTYTMTASAPGYQDKVHDVALKDNNTVQYTFRLVAS